MQSCLMAGIACLVLAAPLRAEPSLAESLRETLFDWVTISVKHPPKHWLDVEQIAFAETRGKCSDEILALLREEFVDRGITVLDREHLETVLQEHGLIKLRLVDEETAIELGEILGATVLISLDVHRCEEDQRREPRENTRLDGSTYWTYTARTSYFVKGEISFVDLETTKIVLSRVFEADVTETAGPSRRSPAFPPLFPVKDETLRLAGLEVIKQLLPWEERAEMLFYDTRKCGLKDVRRRVDLEDYVSAERLAREAIEKCSNRKPKYLARAHYDLGAILLLQSEFADAEKSFEVAYEIDPSPARRAALLYAQRVLRATQDLESYYQFLGADDATQAALALHALESAAEESGSDGSKEKSIAERLRLVKELWEEDLIDHEEYEKKRAEILEGL